MGLKLRPADFARQAGVTKQAISAKIKNGTLVVDDAGFLDTDNPINSAYISEPRRIAKKQAIIPFPATAGVPAASPAPPASMPMTEAELAAAAGVPATELLDYTLRDVVMKFNGIYGLEKHAKTLQYLVVTADKEQRMAERSLRLIPRDFVMSSVFPFLNQLMIQLIEYPEIEADKIISKVLADGPSAREAVVIMLRDGISRIISKSKEQVVKELDSLRGRHASAVKNAEGTPDDEGAEIE